MTKYKVQIVIEDFVEIDDSYMYYSHEIESALLEKVLAKRFNPSDLFSFDFIRFAFLNPMYQRFTHSLDYFQYSNAHLKQIVGTRSLIPLTDQIKSNGDRK
jgi:hypothetical protein